MLIDTTINVWTPGASDGTGHGWRYRIEPAGPHDIFADHGRRPDSVSVGISLHPVVSCPGVGDNVNSMFCDACGQKVNDAPGDIAWHEPTPEAIAAYDMDIQQGAIYLDVTKDELVAVMAMFRRVLDDNDWSNPNA